MVNHTTPRRRYEVHCTASARAHHHTKIRSLFRVIVGYRTFPGTCLWFRKHGIKTEMKPSPAKSCQIKSSLIKLNPIYTTSNYFYVRIQPQSPLIISRCITQDEQMTSLTSSRRRRFHDRKGCNIGSAGWLTCRTAVADLQ